jgi:hypothetical protein
MSTGTKRKGVFTMKKYRIVENIDSWIGNQPANDETLIIDQKELERLAREWEKPIAELMQDLEEIEN